MVLVQAELTRSNVYGGVLAAWLLFWVARWVVRNYVYKRPPGPRQWPVIGSVLDFPKDHEWLTYAKWGEQYGPMVEASIFGQKVIIINKEDIAIGMLEQKNIKYSDRPAIPMANDLVGWKDGLGMLSVGDRFRSHRKMFHQVMGTTATFAEHHAIVEREMHKFLQKIQELPKDLSKHIRSTTGAIVLRLSMGYDALPHNDPFIDLADKGMEIMGLSINVGSFLVNFIPALKYVPQWFPGAGFQKVASDWRRVVQRVINEPYEYGKARFHDNTIARPSFIATMLDESEEELTPLREHDIKWSAASMYIGGVDTSFSAIYAFVLAMVLHPDIAKKAQAELDRVVGDERLPVLADRPTLPYLNALVLEVFRWHAVAPAGLPHLCNADDDYRGYFVSKGTMVVANIWQMLHDPEVYPDPFKFMPERFLGQKPQRDPRNICFGFGRRRCPGMHMGDATVFMAAASILAVYDISKIMKDGKIQEPVVGQLSALISEPAPFECTITVRSQKARDLIESEPLFI